jgi:hypothetical protein
VSYQVIDTETLLLDDDEPTKVKCNQAGLVDVHLRVSLFFFSDCSSFLSILSC